MKKLILKIIVLIGVITMTQSCDDYLSESNPNEISEDVFWSNLDETNTGLNAVYSAMLNEFMFEAISEALRSDMAFPNLRNKPTNNVYYKQLFNSTTSDISKRWTAIYQLIWRANQVINGLEALNEEFKAQEEWTNQMGQARFFRGLGHFYAASVFNKGSIIIRDKIPGNTEEFQKPLSSADEVRAFYRADLEYAYQNLPAQFAEKSRVDGGTAATILGTSYLYEGDYTMAKEYFNDVLNNSDYGYSLVQNTDILFTSAGDFNSESIFEINYGLLQTEDGTWDEESFFTRLARYSAPSNKGGGSAKHSVPSAWLTHAYSSEELDAQDPRNYVDNGTGGVRFRKVSLRASAMIALVNDEDTPYYLSPSVPIAASFGLKFSYFKHFSNHDIAASENDLAETGWKSSKNFILNRLGHVYIMQAECLVKTGDVEGAIDLINEVRARWGLRLIGLEDGSNHDFDGVVYTAETLMDRIMYIEKPLESSIEGFSTRNIDMQRWGIGKARYQELANTQFYLTDYEYTDIDGNPKTASGSLLLKGENPDPVNFTTIDMEYIQAAEFFNPDLHAFLPLPSAETLNNGQVSN
ncbi:RagB/SusD family nutrient uptake outer membrane protein [Lutibacter citreus]|uniref:RagB/SusD family nutrient uptake outer membrane protein n=1 Tax=Lutibacter citreus TaxID=2138210 RepID=UPI000DBE6C8E|nr:RagB/SusD family nutrient uptake outer membrane protein [Lutibacter citreus]